MTVVLRLVAAARGVRRPRARRGRISVRTRDDAGARAQPGSKRMPTLEIGDNGEVVLELWCKGGKGQFSVAGNTVIFVPGPMEDRACPPARAQADDELVAALSERRDLEAAGRFVLTLDRDQAAALPHQHELAIAVIPRHRVSPSASPMTGSGGESSTPRLLDSSEPSRSTGSPGQAGDDRELMCGLRISTPTCRRPSAGLSIPWPAPRPNRCRRADRLPRRGWLRPRD